MSLRSCLEGCGVVGTESSLPLESSFGGLADGEDGGLVILDDNTMMREQ